MTLPVSGVLKVLAGVAVALGVPDDGVGRLAAGEDGNGGVLAAMGEERTGGATDAMGDEPPGGGAEEERYGSAGGMERSEAGPSRYRSLSW